MTGTTYLDLAALAERAGWTYESARTIHKRSTKRRREGAPRPGDLPAPDETFARTPVWKLATIEEWEKNRPGRGTGGGRPRNTA